MRPKKHKTTGSNDLFRARLDQIINMKHELVLLAGKIDWDWIDGEIAPLYSENGRPGIVDVITSAKSLSDVIDKLETAQVLTSQDAALAETTRRFSVSVRHREVVLKQLHRQRLATVARLAEQRATIQGTIGEKKRLLASIHQTIRQIQAREAAH